MTPKITWSQCLGIISEKSACDKPILKRDWQNLLDLANTITKCKDGHNWSMNSDAPDFSLKFYEKMPTLSKGTFKHLRMIVNVAQKREEFVTVDECLQKMIALAENNTVQNWWKSILPLLSADDPRREAVEKNLADLQNNR
jgi:hypothetical protein